MSIKKFIFALLVLLIAVQLCSCAKDPSKKKKKKKNKKDKAKNPPPAEVKPPATLLPEPEPPLLPEPELGQVVVEVRFVEKRYTHGLIGADVVITLHLGDYLPLQFKFKVNKFILLCHRYN